MKRIIFSENVTRLPLLLLLTALIIGTTAILGAGSTSEAQKPPPRFEKLDSALSEVYEDYLELKSASFENGEEHPLIRTFRYFLFAHLNLKNIQVEVLLTDETSFLNVKSDLNLVGFSIERTHYDAKIGRDRIQGHIALVNLGELISLGVVKTISMPTRAINSIPQ